MIAFGGAKHMGARRWRALCGLGLGLVILATALWPAPASHAISWRIASLASTGIGRPLAAPRPIAAPTPAAARPAVAPPTADYRLDRPPSISAAQIDAVLATYNSPAVGTGTVFYDIGLRYGIDPAYALAFYIVESQAGTRGVARFTHAIGNIRTTPGYKAYEGYRAYNTYAEGIEDWFKLIKELYLESWGLTTPDTILPRYAPWGDNNNPVAYASAVKSLVSSWQEPKH